MYVGKGLLIAVETPTPSDDASLLDRSLRLQN